MQLLFENWRKYNSNPFELMCEQYDKKLLTEEKLFEYWKQTTIKELEQLNEIDWEKEAELTADPDYKPPQERRGEMLEKVNDWILKKSIQLVELAKRNAVRAIGSIKWLVDKIDDFCYRFPTVCTIAKWTLVIVALFIAFAFLFANEALAKLARDGRLVDDAVVAAMKGNLVDIIDNAEGKGKTPKHLYKLLAQIDVLHDAKTPHDFAKGKENVDKGLRLAYDFVGDAWRGELEGISKEESRKMVGRWIDIGERTRAWYREETIKTDGFLSRTTDYGKKLINKGK